MIQANELRIGNWVAVGPQQSTVVFITHDRVQVQGNAIINRVDQLEPIPLTPEILEKAGFIYRNEHRGKGAIMDYQNQSVGILENGFRYLTAWKAPCQYIHKLQNLYFTLTGEELTINL